MEPVLLLSGRGVCSRSSVTVLLDPGTGSSSLWNRTLSQRSDADGGLRSSLVAPQTEAATPRLTHGGLTRVLARTADGSGGILGFHSDDRTALTRARSWETM